MANQIKSANKELNTLKMIGKTLLNKNQLNKSGLVCRLYVA